MLKTFLRFSVALPLAFAANAAFAASIDYTLTSTNPSDPVTITFSLPVNPAAAATCAFFGNCATFDGVTVDVTAGGTTTVYNGAQVNFYLAIADGGITIFKNSVAAQTFGDGTMLMVNDGNSVDQLFSGPVTSPTLTFPIPAGYTLSQESYDSPIYNEPYVLTAALGGTVIPEPGSLWLLGSGLLGLAGMMRRRVRR